MYWKQQTYKYQTLSDALFQHKNNPKLTDISRCKCFNESGIITYDAAITHAKFYTYITKRVYD
jgi:hypothetical protein